MNTLYLVVDPWMTASPALPAVAHWATTANFDTLPESVAMVFRDMAERGIDKSKPMVVEFSTHRLIAIYKRDAQPLYAVVHGDDDTRFRMINLRSGSVSCQYHMQDLETIMRGRHGSMVKADCH